MRTFSLGVLALSLSLAFVFTSSSVDAKPAAKKTSQKPTYAPAQTASTDQQVVTKNPDGSVEVTDAPAAAPSSGGGGGYAQPATRQVIYKLAPAGTMKYSDGTIVKRNADGSVEVTDTESQNPTIHWDTPQRSYSRPVARHKARAKKH